jgi:hypothetical protein
MSAEKLNLYQKLALIQSEVKGLGKDKDGHGYKYVTGAKVLEHIKPIMIAQGIILKQEIVSIENVRQDYLTSLVKDNGVWTGKPKTEILSKVMMRFTWIDCESGEKDENSFGANGQNDWDKGVGSALTYAERYFLLKYFHINTDEDDIDNPERKAEELAEQKRIDETKAKEDERLLNIKLDFESSGTLEELAEKYTALSPKDKNTFVKLKDELKIKLTKNK